MVEIEALGTPIGHVNDCGSIDGNRNTDSFADFFLGRSQGESFLHVAIQAAFTLGYQRNSN